MCRPGSDLDHRYQHHPPRTPEAVTAHETIRGGARAFAQLIAEFVPHSPDRDRALDAVDDAMFRANAGIAREGRPQNSPCRCNPGCAPKPGTPMDDLYRERAHLASYLAARHPSRIAYNDPESPDWPVLYVTTPAGQLTWHLSPDDLDLFDHVPVVDPNDPAAQWDGHTTPEKYRRLSALTQALAARTPTKDTP